MNLRLINKNKDIIQKRIEIKEKAQAILRDFDKDQKELILHHNYRQMDQGYAWQLIKDARKYFKGLRIAFADKSYGTIYNVFFAKVDGLEYEEDSLLYLAAASKGKVELTVLQMDEILHGFSFEIKVDKTKSHQYFKRHEFMAPPHQHAEFYFCTLEENIHNAQRILSRNKFWKR